MRELLRARYVELNINEMPGAAAGQLERAVAVQISKFLAKH